MIKGYEADIEIDDNINSKNRIEIDAKCLNLFSEAIVIYSGGRAVAANDRMLILAGIRDVNELEKTGITEQLKSQSDFEKLINERFKEYGKNKSILPFEQKRISADGTIIYLEITAVEHLYEGKPAVMVVIQDITEKRELNRKIQKLEGYIQENQIRYNNIVELSPNAIITYTDDKITYANSMAAGLLGESNSNALIGRSISEFLEVNSDVSKLINYRIQKAKRIDGSIPFSEQKLTKKDGTVIHAEIAATSYPIAGNIETTIVYRDITSRKKMEQVLKETIAKYLALVEMSPDGIFITDRKRVLFANDAGAKLLGCGSPNDIEDRKVTEFLINGCRLISVREVRLPSGELKQSTLIEQHILKENGEVINAEVSNTEITYEGKKALLSVARDITERKKAEENRIQLEKALEYDKIKTEFFSNISHELRTPLNIILGSIQLIESIKAQNGGVMEAARFDRYSGMMKQNCYRLLRLINNLIDITKIDVGFLNMNFTNSNIVEVVEDITLSVSEYVQSKGLSITFDTNSEEIITACDTDKIERIILNLLSNAIKFTAWGGSIFVSVQDDGDSVRISIRDTGIGIPEDMLEKIFERFRQVDPLFTRNKEGSGIGLSLVKSIVEAHDGNITVSSRIGVGSEFIIQLPIRVLQDKESEIDDERFNVQDKVERINIEFSDIYD